MKTNDILDKLEYILESINDEIIRGYYITNYLYDRRYKKLNVPWIIYLLSHYLCQRQLLDFNINNNSEWNNQIYPFVSTPNIEDVDTELDITQKSDVWIKCKHVTKKQKKKAKNIDTSQHLNLLCAILIKKSYFIFKTDVECYVPTQFYEYTLFILFLFLPNAFMEFINNYDDQSMSTCKNAIVEVLEFVKDFENVKDNIECRKILFDPQRQNGTIFRNAFVETFEYEDDGDQEWAFSILRERLSTFNNCIKHCIDNQKYVNVCNIIGVAI